MELQEAKEKFISSWGALGSSWGINKAMAQIHALLLINEEPLTTDQIMEELGISRGNANMNIRQLIDWSIVFKVNVKRDRKEYFTAKKDIWELAKQVTRERRKREIEPVITLLAEFQKEDLGKSKEAKTFKTVTGRIHEFANTIDSVLDRFQKSDNNWFGKIIVKILK